MIRNFNISLRLSHTGLSADEIISLILFERAPSTSVSVGKVRMLEGRITKPMPKSIVTYQLMEKFLDGYAQSEINEEILRQVENLKIRKKFFDDFHTIGGISSLGIGVFSGDLGGSLLLNRHAIHALGQLHINNEIYFYSSEKDSE